MKNNYSLKDLAGIRKKGEVSKLYLEGKINDDVMVVYIEALEEYKKVTGNTQDEWLKLKKSCSMYSVDRSQCKSYWLKI